MISFQLEQPNPLEGEPLDYPSYIEFVTDKLMFDVNNDQLQPSEINEFASALFNSPLVRIPNLDFEIPNANEILFLAHRQAIEAEESFNPKLFELDNKKAKLEIDEYFRNCNRSLRKLAEAKGVSSSQISTIEILDIAQEEIKSKTLRVEAEQILTGKPISKREAAWISRINNFAIPNALCAIKIRAFLVGYSFNLPKSN
jgi:hypothetical protein